MGAGGIGVSADMHQLLRFKSPQVGHQIHLAGGSDLFLRYPQNKRAASEREKIMYDLTFIIALFETLPADAQQEILDLAARLAADTNSKEQ